MEGSATGQSLSPKTTSSPLLSTSMQIFLIGLYTPTDMFSVYFIYLFIKRFIFVEKSYECSEPGWLCDYVDFLHRLSSIL